MPRDEESCSGNRTRSPMLEAKYAGSKISALSPTPESLNNNLPLNQQISITWKLVINANFRCYLRPVK